MEDPISVSCSCVGAVALRGRAAETKYRLHSCGQSRVGPVGRLRWLLRGAPTPRIDKLAGEGLKLLNFPKEFDMSYDRNQPVLDALPGRSP
jgi:hypothetical protein